ncbi:hypothetical protein HELRODRAFT_164781 [Helobdella robusta]|uniref:Uncharacterized protein n=1 Tax=Helobdella robusta TaxID=6412 RepID=T1EVT2_HELRO|nr:hypothetical protein HELRODRAFT_164781 [Helobdella robusta]ESN92692.1 hypothetical protein HELRODRAFT_164781 [Helobdella robusta]
MKYNHPPPVYTANDVEECLEVEPSTLYSDERQSHLQPPLKDFPQEPKPAKKTYIYTVGKKLESGSENMKVIQIDEPGDVVIVGNEDRVDFTGAIVYSCIVIFCFGWICGLIAFILASLTIGIIVIVTLLAMRSDNK